MSQITPPRPRCPEGHPLPTWAPRWDFVLKRIRECGLCQAEANIEQFKKLQGAAKL